MPRPIGIFGGTFDPIHHGHLRAALEVAEALALATVRFVPCGVPPHRAAPHAPAGERRSLIVEAIADEARFALDARELERTGPSYTVDTLRELRAELGARQPLVLLVGADACAGLERWHRWRELFELAHLARLARPGAAAVPPGALAAELDRRRTSDAARFATAPAGAVWEQALTALDISSSELRARLARGASVRYLVPDRIIGSLSSGSYRPVREA